VTRKTTTYARKRRLAVGRERMDGITATSMHTTRLTAPELERLLRPIQLGLARAREGRCSHEDYVSLCTAMHKARAIDDMRIFRGLRAMIDAAEQPLRNLEQRALASGTWCAPTLYAAEITALDDLVFAYRTMVLEVTYAEFVRADSLAVARVASAGGEVLYPNAEVHA